MRFERGPFGRIAISTVSSEDDVALHALDILQNHVISSILPVYLRSQTGKVQICIDCTGYVSLSEIKMHQWNNMDQKRKCIADFLQTILIAQDYFLDADFLVIDSQYIFFDLETEKLFWCYLPFTHQEIEEGKTGKNNFWEKLELLLMDPFFSDVLEEEDRNHVLCMFRDEQEEDLLAYLSDFPTKNIHADQKVSSANTLQNRLSLQFFIMAACFILCVSTDWRQFPGLSENKWAFLYVVIYTLLLFINLLVKKGKRPSTDLVQKNKDLESQKSISRKNLYFPMPSNTDSRYSIGGGDALFSPAFLTQSQFSASKSEKPLKAVIWVSDFLIGSDRCLCDFCIDHVSISDRHARILFRKPLYFLVDLGSSDGTWIGSRRLYSYEESPLTDGDVIVCGQMQFVFNYTVQT